MAVILKRLIYEDKNLDPVLFFAKYLNVDTGSSIHFPKQKTAYNGTEKIPFTIPKFSVEMRMP